MDTLRDFVELAVEKYYECSIWDFEKEQVVYRGDLDDIPDELLEREFSSWEIEEGIIVLNIN